ncbi:MAG TPA: hypothetical protein VMR62_34370 [Bryobacteraceae bacterium]|nr:hypothetical protein [Bryobacteraceae bacterium]
MKRDWWNDGALFQDDEALDHFAYLVNELRTNRLGHHRTLSELRVTQFHFRPSGVFEPVTLFVIPQPGISGDSLRCFCEPVSVDGKRVLPVAHIRYGLGAVSGSKGDGHHAGGAGLIAKPVGVVEVTQFQSRDLL